VTVLVVVRVVQRGGVLLVKHQPSRHELDVHDGTYLRNVIVGAAELRAAGHVCAQSETTRRADGVVQEAWLSAGTSVQRRARRSRAGGHLLTCWQGCGCPLVDPRRCPLAALGSEMWGRAMFVRWARVWWRLVGYTAAALRPRPAAIRSSLVACAAA
jgi:hypothetical protein